MKRMIAMLLVLSMLFALSACKGKNTVTQNTEGSKAQTEIGTEQTQGSTEQTQGSTEQTENSTDQTENNSTPPEEDKVIMLDTEALSLKLKQMRAQYNVAGMAVAVTDGEKIIYSEGFGVDSVDNPDVPTSKDSVYRIASVSKTFTALVIMRLCEEGDLELDKPIINYIPDIQFSNPKANDTMTLRHLLTHTGGMPADDYMHAGSTDESTMNDVILETLPTLKLSSLPGEGKYQYSTWGYNLIGCVASVVTGKSLSQLVSEYILDPLDMTATTFSYEVASNLEQPLSQPHITSSGKHKVDKLLINTAFNAGAGLYSNTEDMCKFARFFLNGGVSDSGERVLAEEYLKMMTSMQIERSDTSYYGFGVSANLFAGRYIYGHSGTYYGQNYFCSFIMDAKTGCGVVTLMNTMPTDKNFRMLVPQMIFNLLDQ